VAVILIIVAAVWSVVVGDIVLETASSDRAGIMAFGQVVVEGTRASRTWILAGLVASAALLLALAVAYAVFRRGRGHTARAVSSAVAEGVGRTEAGMGARDELLAWRISELDRRVSALEERRPRDDDGISPSRRLAYERSGMASGERRILSELARAVGSDDITIELPETETRERGGGDAPGLSERDAGKEPHAASEAERRHDDRLGF
jgi:hypothetical protein